MDLLPEKQFIHLRESLETIKTLTEEVQIICKLRQKATESSKNKEKNEKEKSEEAIKEIHNRDSVTKKELKGDKGFERHANVDKMITNGNNMKEEMATNKTTDELNNEIEVKLLQVKLKIEETEKLFKDLKQMLNDQTNMQITSGKNQQIQNLNELELNQLEEEKETYKIQIMELEKPPEKPPESSFGWKAAAIGGAVGAVGLVVATPFILGAVGFGTAGIAAGSIAAKMMSAAAIANGGGVAAGSAVAVLQSVGAAGLGVAGTAAVAGTGAAAGTAAGAGVWKIRNLFQRSQ